MNFKERACEGLFLTAELLYGTPRPKGYIEKELKKAISQTLDQYRLSDQKQTTGTKQDILANLNKFYGCMFECEDYEALENFISQSLDSYLESVIPEKVGEENIKWLNEARQKFERDKKMFDDEPDDGEVWSASEAVASDTGFNICIDQIRHNAGLKVDDK